MAVSKKASAGNKQTTVSAASRPVTPENKQQHGKTYNPGSTPVKFYEDEMRRMNMQTQARAPHARGSPNAAPRGFSLKRLAAQLVALYAVIAYLFICPNDPSRAPEVCRSFQQIEHYRNQALDFVSPYTQPYVSTIRSQAEQYYSPYVKAAEPYYTRVNNVIAPPTRTVKTIYESTVKPRVLDAVTRSHKQVTPHLTRVSNEWHKLVDPPLNRYLGLAEELYDLNVHPHVERLTHAFNKNVGPHYARTSAQAKAFTNKAIPVAQHHVRHTFLPFASKTYNTSTHVYGKQVHPRLMTTWEYIKALLRGHFIPAVKRFNSKYISPQVSKIQDKAWANKAKAAADEKVKEMDHDLGKAVLEGEISDLLHGSKASPLAETTFTVTTSTLLPVEPTAIDVEEKDDAIAQKIAQEEAQAQAALEKRAALVALHDMYDVEIEKLGQTELKLLAERLTSLRSAALRDIPVRFDLAVKNYKVDCDKWVGRLEKYYDKASKDRRASVEDKIADGILVARKARSKLADQADELEDELDSYARTHHVRELTSVEKAFKTIQNFVAEAQSKLGQGYTWLDDVTADDWKRYHTLGAAEGSWHYQLAGLRNGTVRHSSLDKRLHVEPVLEELKREVDTITADAEYRLDAAQSTGEAHIKGQFAGLKDAVQHGQTKLAEVFDGATVKGTTQPTPTDVQGTVSSVYSEASASAESAYSVAASGAGDVLSGASASASSVYSAITTASVLSAVASGAEDVYSSVSQGGEYVLSELSSVMLPTNVAKALDDAQSSLSSGIGAASQSLMKLGGAQPSPTDASQSASSLLAQATSYLVNVRESAESVFSSYGIEATNSARSLAGLKTSPTDAVGTASSVYSMASESAASAADKMASEISQAAVNAQQMLDRIAGDAYAALPTLPGTTDLPAYADVSSTLSSQLHDATRAAVRAVGGSVSPEGFAEHASSLYEEASSLAASAVDEASSQLHTATRTVAKAVGATPTPENAADYMEFVASDASEAIRKATEAVRQRMEL